MEAMAARVRELAEQLDAADQQPQGRTTRALELTGELDRLAEQLRTHAIIAAITEGKLSLREIGALVGLSAPQVRERAKKQGIDTNRRPDGSLKRDTTGRGRRAAQ